MVLLTVRQCHIVFKGQSFWEMDQGCFFRTIAGKIL